MHYIRTVINGLLCFKALLLDFKNTPQSCLVVPFMVLEQKSRKNNKLGLIPCVTFVTSVLLTGSSNLYSISVDFQDQGIKH